MKSSKDAVSKELQEHIERIVLLKMAELYESAAASIRSQIQAHAERAEKDKARSLALWPKLGADD